MIRIRTKINTIIIRILDERAHFFKLSKDLLKVSLTLKVIYCLIFEHL